MLRSYNRIKELVWVQCIIELQKVRKSYGYASAGSLCAVNEQFIEAFLCCTTSTAAISSEAIFYEFRGFRKVLKDICIFLIFDVDVEEGRGAERVVIEAGGWRSVDDTLQVILIFFRNLR